MGRDIMQQQKNTTIIHCIVPLVMHKFLPESTQGKKIGQCSRMDKCCPHVTALLKLLCWNKDIVIFCVLVREEGGEVLLDDWRSKIMVRWSAHLPKLGEEEKKKMNLREYHPIFFFLRETARPQIQLR